MNKELKEIKMKPSSVNMPKSTSASHKNTKRFKNPRSVFFGLVFCVFISLGLVLISVTPPKYEISPGEIAKSTIQAPRDVIDTITTQNLISKAVADVAPVFKEDPAITQSVIDSVENYFKILEEIRAYSERKFLLGRTPTEGVAEEFIPSRISWNVVLTSENINTINVMSDNIFTAEEVYLISSMTAPAIERIKNDATNLIQKELKLGVKEENLDEHIIRISTQIYTNPAYTENLKRFATKAAYYLESNMIYDQTATDVVKREAENSVVPASYKQGQNIIQEGEIVSLAQVQVLDDLGLVKNDVIDYELYFGVSIYIIILFALFYAYLLVFEKRLTLDIKRMTILYILICTTVALAFGIYFLSPMLTSVFMGAIMVGALIKPRTAIMTAILLALLTAPISASNEGVLSVSAFNYSVYALSGGMCAVYFIRRTQHRMTFVLSGIAAGFLGALTIVAFSLVTDIPSDKLLSYSILSLISGLTAGIIAIGLLPIFESMFKLATPSKLLELLNPDQKLLRRLSIEAPSTYHHSTVCANLAESAAEAIHANSLLSRTAGYYHDIGKLKNPNMFTENQRNGNPHDTMPPEVSAEIIKTHVSYGVYLAAKHNLPKEIISIIEQHHGTTFMAVFYAKAKTENPDISPDKFRYSGPKPQTREAAIIMLADVCEAAVRSTGLSERDKILGLLHKLIKERVDDGQFDECDISLKDLHLIKQAFLSVYDGVFHERVKYPDEDKRDG